MGNFYVNYTLGGVKQQAVADALAGRKCMVTPPMNNSVVVYDLQSDSQDQAIISGLAKRLSGQLNCPVLAVLNHDDDILWYALYCRGELRDEYDSSPGYFDGDVTEPKGGDAQTLCSLFGSAQVDDVESILRSPLEEAKYVFALQRHDDLVHALGISPFGVGGCYKYAEDGEIPEGLDESQIIRLK